MREAVTLLEEGVDSTRKAARPSPTVPSPITHTKPNSPRMRMDGEGSGTAAIRGDSPLAPPRRGFTNYKPNIHPTNTLPTPLPSVAVGSRTS